MTEKWESLPSEAKELFWRIESTMIYPETPEDIGRLDMLVTMQKHVISYGFAQGSGALEENAATLRAAKAGWFMRGYQEKYETQIGID